MRRREGRGGGGGADDRRGNGEAPAGEGCKPGRVGIYKVPEHEGIKGVRSQKCLFASLGTDRSSRVV